MTELSPQIAAERMMALSEEQSRLGGEATELEIKQTLYCHAYRAEHASDKAVERAWSVTEDGQRQIRVEGRLGVLKSELSVIKNYLRHSENVGRNIY